MKLHKTLLLTRSIAQNLELKKGLKQYNFKFVSCPLIKYTDLGFDPILLKDYSNIIITSKHAAAIVPQDSTTMPVWVVGNRSAEILKGRGFAVKYVAENIQDLIKHLPQNIYNQTIYLSANEVTIALPPAIKRQIIYEVEYCNTLGVEQQKAINQGIDYILLYSQNCAKTLIKLLKQYNLLKIVENTIVIAVSLKVAKEVQPYFKNVVYCNGGQYNKMKELLISYAKAEK